MALAFVRVKIYIGGTGYNESRCVPRKCANLRFNAGYHKNDIVVGRRASIVSFSLGLRDFRVSFRCERSPRWLENETRIINELAGFSRHRVFLGTRKSAGSLIRIGLRLLKCHVYTILNYGAV